MDRRTSPCGRPVPKPVQKELEYTELNEEALPIHLQIDNLRTKIALKERYNHVLKDELEESRVGASSVLRDLIDETLTLRQNLIDAIGKEKFAVQNALRTHRLFQLPLRSRTPEFAIAWLDDKLFDFSKQLNLLVEQLLRKRKKLREAEALVQAIEKWPRPGSLPWEAEVNRRVQQINIATSNMEVKLETARVLCNKYEEIKEKLRSEEEHYSPIIRNLNAQLKTQTMELNTLQKMLDDAEFFQTDAVANLSSTEHEASLNRKTRRIQMARIKKAVEKVLEENTKLHPYPSERRTSIETPLHSVVNNSISSKGILRQDENSHLQLIDRLRYKKAEIVNLQIWISQLVDTMRVPDMTYVPLRLTTAIHLSGQLTSETESRSQLCEVLTNQRNQLLLILHQVRYTGNAEEIEFQKVLSDYDLTITKTEKEVELARSQLNKIGGTVSSLRTAMISILVQLEKEDILKHQRMRSTNQLIRHMPTIHNKIKQLVSSVNDLKSQFENPSERDYSVGVKAPPLPERWCRVQTPNVSDLSEEEDYEDYKVPTRAEILARSQKIIIQGKLRRGIN